MQDQPIPITNGNSILPPIDPGPEVKELCNKIDGFYRKHPTQQHKIPKAFDLITGAFYAMRSECRTTNPDWMSQAATSAREILYYLSENARKTLYSLSEDNVREYAETIDPNNIDTLETIYNKLTDLTHHGTAPKSFSEKEFDAFSDSAFETLMKKYICLLGSAFSIQQSSVLTIIDGIVQNDNTNILPVVDFDPEVQKLCDKIDNFYCAYPKRPRNQKASDLVKGVLYAMRPACRSNPDWMSQAANSARGILYPLISQISHENLIKLFRKYITDPKLKLQINDQKFINTFNSLDTIYKKLSNLTHHRDKENNFEALMKEYIRVLGQALRLQQVYVHTIIDGIIQGSTKSKKDDVEFILKINLDAYQYFYDKADEGWLDWLWQHGFLDVLKEKTDDTRGYEYRHPELNYLVRMAEKDPGKVVNMIMLKIPISTDTCDTFNRNLVLDFLRICRTLPADQLERVVEKICHERWVPLGVESNQSYHLDFAYKEMFQTLAAAEKYKSIIVLAEAVLAVRPREKMEEGPLGRFLGNRNPFYFDKLLRTNVFVCLVQVDTTYAEQALALTTKVMTKVFEIFGFLPLPAVNFCTLELGQDHILLSKNYVKELTATFKVLATRLIKQKCAKEAEFKDVRRIYEAYIDVLPNGREMWRLRLYIWSLCPQIFQAELKEAFFLLFETERSDYLAYFEYLHALREGFSVLSADDKQDFVKRIIEKFSQQPKDKEYGLNILSMILPYLNEQPALKEQVEKAGFILDPTYEPQPAIGEVEGGWGVARGPLTQEEFGQLPIADIAKKLCNAWSPEQLSVQNTDDDFLHPLNAEDVVNLLKTDMRARLPVYVAHAAHFFDRERLDPHYTYAYLRGVQEALQHQKPAVDWDNVIALCSAIKEAGETDPFERETRETDWFDTWLANWDAIHSAMSDLLQELLTEKDGQVLIDFGKHHNQIFSVIQYLLSHPNPSPADEEDKNLFTVAMQSVRGKTFEVFVWFVEQDGKRFNPEDQVTISDDVKALYEDILRRENTRALMFLFGRYLPYFYARDKEWIRQLLPRIFPKYPSKRYLYTAAWEGYLSNNTLYTDVFYDPAIQQLYQRGLALTDDDYPPQQGHFREPDEGIAKHLALAFMYDQEFGLDHPLFIAFWEKDNPKWHAHFVDFLGNQFIFRSRASEHLARRLERKKWLRDFWDWLLDKHENPETFRQFGHWIDLEKEIFAPAWLAERVRKTLEKTNGIVEEHKLNNTETNVQLARAAPQDTLEIARLYLLEGEVRNDKSYWSLNGDEWDDALRILYETPETKIGTENLINELVEGGRPFWGLAEIVRTP